jgi:hypothetical protein
MRDTFKHRKISVFIEQTDDETFLFGFELKGREIRGTVRIRPAGMARKRAQKLINR